MSEQKLFSIDMKDLFLESNEKIGQLRDDLIQNIDRINACINHIFSQTKQESKSKKNQCRICNFVSNNSSSFELHHIAGQKHDYRTITVCKNCHRILSDEQKLRDSRWWVQNQPENIRKAFFLQGLYDILCLKSRKTGDSVYEKYAVKFVEQIAVLLRSNKQ